MAYAPDIFSTKGGLTITAIRGWIQHNDTATIEQWLNSGNAHPRLAAEAIGLAVELNRPTIAERIWQARRHTPGAALKEAWNGWKTALSQHKNTRLPDAGKHKETWGWLLNKHTGATERKTAKLHSDYLLEGMYLSLIFNAPERWNDLVAMRREVDFNSEAAHKVLRYAMTYTPWAKITYENDNHPWVENQAIPQLLDNGLKPGGTVWVNALEHEPAQPFLDHLMARVESLTTPRMRAATIVAADTTTTPIPDRWKTVINTFFSLGVPETISLSRKEAPDHIGPHGRMHIALADIGFDTIDSKLSNEVERLFSTNELDVLSALTAITQEKIRLLFRAQGMGDELPQPIPRTPKPRF